MPSAQPLATIHEFGPFRLDAEDSRQFAGVDCAPALAASLGEALRTIGLPE
jgi:hypothetical protein